MIIKDGKEYARVSEILRPFSDFSHIDPEVLAHKCRIGTQVHEAIADEIKGEFPFLRPDSYGYFKSFLAWNNEIKPHFQKSEERYYSEKHMVTGQIDALILLGSRLPFLIDFKTSASEGESWTLQGHLYAMLLEEAGVKIQDKYLFIKLDKNGMLPRVFEYKFDFNLRSKCLNAIDNFWKMRKSDSNLIATPL